MTLVTVLTSGGDVLSGYVDVTSPVHGPARIHRGFAVLRRMPALVLFTSYGRKRWHGTWMAGRVSAATPAAVRQTRPSCC